MGLLARFYPYIAGLALLLAATVWVYMRGYHDCQAKIALSVIKEDKVHDKIAEKVNAVPDSALDKRLHKWVYKN